MALDQRSLDSAASSSSSSSRGERLREYSDLGATPAGSTEVRLHGSEAIRSEAIVTSTERKDAVDEAARHVVVGHGLGDLAEPVREVGRARARGRDGEIAVDVGRAKAFLPTRLRPLVTPQRRPAPIAPMRFQRVLGATSKGSNPPPEARTSPVVDFVGSQPAREAVLARADLVEREGRDRVKGLTVDRRRGGPD